MRDSQCWNTDALVDSTKNGSPMLPASSRSSHASGLPSGGVAEPAWIMNGSTAAGAMSTAACRTTWCRSCSQRDAASAYPYPASITIWKKTTQPFQTIGTPPRIGSTILAAIGSTRNRRNPLRNMVVANSGTISDE